VLTDKIKKVKIQESYEISSSISNN
jgi:hypothetical protein